MRRRKLHAPRPRPVVPAAVLALLLLGTASCAATGRLADDAARGADDAARGADDAPLPLPDVPAAPPAQAGAGSQDAAELAAQVVATHTGDLDPVTTQRVVWSACTADGLLEAGRADTVAEAAGKVLADHGGIATLRLRVEGLTADLQKAGSSGERVWLSAKAAICEAA